jgi:hypothetical protein
MSRTCDNVPSTTSTTLAILTLRRHKDGIWIQKLVEALQIVRPSSQQLSVQIVVLEDLFRGPLSISHEGILSHSLKTSWRGLVNRVSDAAEPWEVKACVALLQIAKLMQIRVFNGPEAFSLCTNKWCHHVLFQRANLKSPDTVACLQQQDNMGTPEDSSDLGGLAVKLLYKLEKEQNVVEKFQCDDIGVIDYLVKPNSGGFGAGIQRRSCNKRCLDDKFTAPTDCVNLPCYADRFVLFQKYVPPYEHKIYRVWFLMGKVQCAVVRSITSISPRSGSLTLNGGDEEFTTGCVGGVCHRPNRLSRQSSNIQPWAISDDVR